MVLAVEGGVQSLLNTLYISKSCRRWRQITMIDAPMHWKIFKIWENGCKFCKWLVFIGMKTAIIKIRWQRKKLWRKLAAATKSKTKIFEFWLDQNEIKQVTEALEPTQHSIMFLWLRLGLNLHFQGCGQFFIELLLTGTLPPNLHLASSEQWCWSGGRGILTELSLCYSLVLCSISAMHIAQS